jgi:ketosteroid isomerase-like protein
VKRLFPIAALAAVAVLTGRTSAGAAGAGPEALVEAEQAFARAADTGTVRDAFLEFLAPTAVVFQNGPVNARKLYQSSKPGHSRLAWQPALAAMSGAGDLGWTTGPWQWRSDGSRTAPEATGEYTTVWRRQPDGTLKVVLDLGIDHPAPPAGTPAPVPVLLALGGTHSTRAPLAARNALWKADAEYTRVTATQGHAAAFAAVATADARLLRQGTFPVIGREAARDTLAAHATTEHLMSTAQYISDSGDLGYTYGTLVARSVASADSSYYLHIWHRVAGQPWQLAFELVKPAKD